MYYLAGPMGGYKNYNFPMFWRVAQRMRKKGLEVWNPAEADVETGRVTLQTPLGVVLKAHTNYDGDWNDIVVNDENFDRRVAMRADYEMLLKCSALVLLPGWQHSRGARNERMCADDIGLPIYEYDEAVGVLVPHVPPALIGISGYARSGKDTVAKTIVEYACNGVGLVAYHEHFAAPIKDLLMALNPVIADGDSYYPLTTLFPEGGTEEEWTEAKKVENIRCLLQRLGTEGGRYVLGPNVWVESMIRRLQPGALHVISDVRFPQEYDWIAMSGGQVWNVVRDGVGPANEHESENSLVGRTYPVVIRNTGSLEELKAETIRRFDEFQQRVALSATQVAVSGV